MNCKQSLIISLLFYSILISSSFAKETINRAANWENFTVYGSFKNYSNWHYGYETQVRLFLNGAPFYDQYYNRFALGYSLDSLTQLWLGYDFRLINPNANLMLEQRIWYQLLREFCNSTQDLTFTSRTRLEQRFRSKDSGISWRIRERLLSTIPIKQGTKIRYVFYDEFFVNLNNPKWTSPFLIDEHRVFLGIEFPVIARTTFTVGYLNQLFFKVPKNEMNHVMYLSLDVKL